jgi:hypothetical protein
VRSRCLAPGRLAVPVLMSIRATTKIIQKGWLAPLGTALQPPPLSRRGSGRPRRPMPSGPANLALSMAPSFPQPSRLWPASAPDAKRACQPGIARGTFLPSAVEAKGACQPGNVHDIPVRQLGDVWPEH